MQAVRLRPPRRQAQGVAHAFFFSPMQAPGLALSFHPSSARGAHSERLVADSALLALDSVRLALDSVRLAVDSVRLAVDSVFFLLLLGGTRRTFAERNVVDLTHPLLKL